MDIEFGLHVVTLVMCIITLAMATAALMPQIKLGLILIRDGFLWAVLLGVLGFVGFIGWSRLHEVRQERRSQNETTVNLEAFQAPDVLAPDRSMPLSTSSGGNRSRSVRRGDLITSSVSGLRSNSSARSELRDFKTRSASVNAGIRPNRSWQPTESESPQLRPVYPPDH